MAEAQQVERPSRSWARARAGAPACRAGRRDTPRPSAVPTRSGPAIWAGRRPPFRCAALVSTAAPLSQGARVSAVVPCRTVRDGSAPRPRSESACHAIALIRAASSMAMPRDEVIDHSFSAPLRLGWTGRHLWSITPGQGRPDHRHERNEATAMRAAGRQGVGVSRLAPIRAFGRGGRAGCPVLGGNAGHR